MKNSTGMREQKPVATTHPTTTAYKSLMICALLFLLCILISITPLTRLGGNSFLLALPTSSLLLLPGGWLPVALPLTSNVLAAQYTTHLISFLLCIALAYGIYALAILLLRRIRIDEVPRTYTWIWSVAIIGGMIYIFTPAMLSRDIFVYAGYGRVLAIHHANPYFIPLSAFPQDPFNTLDDWHRVPSAYGPVWQLLCTCISWLVGDQPLGYLLSYRALGLLSHLANIALVIAILRSLKGSPRTVALGALLYAWNPLVLEESALGGHNDTFMLSFILLGIVFAAQAIQRPTQPTGWRLRSYLPAIFTLTLATLIKFTAAPLILLLLVLLASTLYRQARVQGKELHASARTILLPLLSAMLVSGAVVLLLYIPFWIGWSIKDIVASFTSPPSSSGAYGSILFALQESIRLEGLPAQPWAAFLMKLFSQHSIWSAMNLLALSIVLVCSSLWLWRKPTITRYMITGLATLGTLLLVTPWFFPWYVIWLVGLTAVNQEYQPDEKRIASSLSGAALVFSASAFCIYLFAKDIPPVGGWRGWTCLTTIGPTLITFVALYWRKPGWKMTDGKKL